MFVRQGREGNWRELAILQPMDSRSVNRNSLLRSDIRSILSTQTPKTELRESKLLRQKTIWNQASTHGTPDRLLSEKIAHKTTTQRKENRKKKVHLQVVVLTLLFCLEPQSSQTPQILLAHRLIHSGTLEEEPPTKRREQEGVSHKQITRIPSRNQE